MNPITHKTGNGRAPYVTLNDPSKVTDRDKRVMLSKNPIAQSVVQMLHRDRQYQEDFIPSNSNVYGIGDSIADKIQVYKDIQEQLPDIKAAKRIRTSMILSPNDLMTLALNYTCEGSFLPPELVRRLLDDVKSVFDTDEYDLKKYLKQITDDITVDTGSYALAVIPEPTINDVINAPDTIALERNFESLIKKLDRKKSEALVFGKATEGFSHIKCDYNNVLFKGKEGITRADILGYTIHEGIETIQLCFLNKIRNKLKVENRYKAEFSGIEGLNETLNSSDGIGNEDNNNKVDIDTFKKEIFQTKPNTNIGTIKLNETNWHTRPAVGHPMTIHYPSECVIPIHVPGDPTSHIGFLILTGSDNNPLTRVKESNSFSNFLGGLGYDSSNGMNSGSTYGEVLSSIDRYQNGTSCQYSKGFSPNELLAIAKRIIEDDVTERLYNGTYNSSSQAISCPENVALIMLSYRLADMNVNLQFIPANLMTYFALDYDELGIGRSCLEDVKLIASLRSALQLADAMSGIKNSIGNTKLRLGVDCYDPNIQQTVQSVIQRIASVRSMTHILNNNSPTNIANFMASAFMQVEVNVEDGGSGDGTNPIPGTKVEVSEEAPNYPGPSSELKEDLRSKSLLGVGPPQELVDATTQVDFAASIIHSNLMLNKQSLEDQVIINGHLSNHIRQFTMNSGKLMKMFVTTIKEEKDTLTNYLPKDTNYTVKQIIDEFVNHLTVSLPKPNFNMHEAQEAALENYAKLVDSAVEICMTNGLAGHIIEGVNNSDEANGSGTNTEQLAGIIKMHLIRDFMQSNNILPEFFELFDDNENCANINDILDSLTGETNVAITAYGKLKAMIVGKIEEVKSQNNALSATEEDDDSSDTYPDSPEDDNSFSDSSDDNDDFNFDESDDGNNDEPSSEDEKEGGDNEKDSTEIENGDEGGGFNGEDEPTPVE
jgi:hypothetical protein